MTDVRDLWYRGLRRVAGILLVAAGSSHPAAAPLTVSFEDRSAGSGLEVVLHNAASPVRHQIETSVGGVAALDYDGDGFLDLFVVNYVAWNPETEQVCKDSKSGENAYCHPQFYSGLPNTLYHNNGDGTFTDVSAQSGIRAHVGKGMSVAFADY